MEKARQAQTAATSGAMSELRQAIDEMERQALSRGLALAPAVVNRLIAEVKKATDDLSEAPGL